MVCLLACGRLSRDEAPMASRPPLPRNVWVLGFVSLFMDLSSEIYHALLPAFITMVLGLPVTALGAIDGVAEATSNFAKLFSGRLSDRSLKRKPWVMAGYGLAALSKPLFPLAASATAVMIARFADRIGKGIRGAPRDAMLADETPPEIRGRAFGLRQALDTAGALLAPLTLAIFNLAYVALAYPAGALSDRMSPRAILMAGIVVLIAGNIVLAETNGFAGVAVGAILWGAHMALTQGIFARMIADSAPEKLRATSLGAFYFVSGLGGLLASTGAGWLWDRQGASATFLTSAAVAAVALAMLSLLEEDRSSPSRRRGEGDQP